MVELPIIIVSIEYRVEVEDFRGSLAYLAGACGATKSAVNYVLWEARGKD